MVHWAFMAKAIRPLFHYLYFQNRLWSTYLSQTVLSDHYSFRMQSSFIRIVTGCSAEMMQKTPVCPGHGILIHKRFFYNCFPIIHGPFTIWPNEHKQHYGLDIFKAFRPFKVYCCTCRIAKNKVCLKDSEQITGILTHIGHTPI